jgi:hypothetical protein
MEMAGGVFLSRRLTFAALVATSVVAGLGAGFAFAPAGAQVTWGQAVEVSAPAGAQSPTFQGVSCVSAGNCTAVGYAIGELIAATETSGSWSAAVEVQLPGNASGSFYVYAGAEQAPALDGVACTSPGNCEAVGGYFDTSRSAQLLAVTETNGVWGQASEVQSPGPGGTNGYTSVLDSVSCTSFGNCEAVGKYVDPSGNMIPIAATETNGTWGQATEVQAPPDANTDLEDAYFSSLWCISVDDCEAVGQYTPTYNNPQAMVATEVKGTWAQATRANAPTDSVETTLTGLSCASIGNCEAVGDYSDASNSGHIDALAQINGDWGQTVTLNAPTEAVMPTLTGLSCTSTGNCEAVGWYDTSSGGQPGFAIAETNGAWGQPAQVSAPANSMGDSSLYGLSCSTTEDCEAVGSYVDSSGNTDLLAVGTTGTGGTGTNAPTSVSVSASPNPSTYGQSVNVTAAVSSSGGTPTGTVTFSDGAQNLGSATLNADGNATVTTSALPAGTDQITASYAGATGFSPSSGSVAEVVNKAPTTLQVAPAVLSVTSLELTVLSVSATLNWSQGALAGQLVTFTAGATYLCSAVTNPAGVATCQTSPIQEPQVVLAGGDSATYAGGPNFLAAHANGTLIG